MDGEIESPAGPSDNKDPSNRSKRAVCQKCSRPQRVCICSVLPFEPIELSTRIIIMQTTAESKAKIKTGGIVPLCLRHARIISAKKESEAFIPPTAVLLFPGEGSEPLDRVSNPSVIVLLDATWDTAKRVLSRSPFLRSLQKAYLPEHVLHRPIFKARKPPQASIKGARSTAEAVASALECVERDAAANAVKSIRAAVHESSEMQLRFIRGKGAGAGRHRVDRKGYEVRLYDESSS